MVVAIFFETDIQAGVQTKSWVLNQFLQSILSLYHKVWSWNTGSEVNEKRENLWKIYLMREGVWEIRILK